MNGRKYAKRWLSRIGVGILLLVSGSAVDAATYYVSITGTDTNPGSITAPWRTIQKAANTLAPGDTALIETGTYNESVTVNVSGTTGALITFQAYPGAAPVLDGSGLTPPNYQSGMFHLLNTAFVVINGFEIRNYTTSNKNAVPAGIYVEGGSHDIQLLNNKVHGIQNNYNGVAANAFGIAFYGTSSTQPISNLIVEGNEVYNLITGSSESVTFNGNVDGFQVLDNLVHDTDNIGIDFIGFEGTCPDPTQDQARNGICRGNTVWDIDTTGNPAYKSGTTYDPSADGLYVDGGTNIVIDRNVVSYADLGIEVSSEHATHYASYITVRDNFVHHCYTTGISTGGYNKSVGWSQNCTFTNNTLYQNDTLQQGNGELELQYNVTDCVFEGNILYDGPQDLLMSNFYTANTGNTVDYNVYYTLDGNSVSQWQWKKVNYTGTSAYETATGNDMHSIFIDPQLIATGTAPNLRVKPTSPVIDVGNPAFVSGTDELDIDGNARVINSRVDIGAEEMAPIERWRYANFSTAQLSNSAISGDLADPDGDGIPNILEYALGTNPAGSNALPVTGSMSGGYLALTFPRLQVATDVTYNVQSSGDLLNWTQIWSSGTSAYTGGSNPSVEVTVPDTVLATGTGKRFMRLQVTKP